MESFVESRELDKEEMTMRKMTIKSLVVQVALAGLLCASTRAGAFWFADSSVYTTLATTAGGLQNTSGAGQDLQAPVAPVTSAATSDKEAGQQKEAANFVSQVSFVTLESRVR